MKNIKTTRNGNGSELGSELMSAVIGAPFSPIYRQPTLSRIIPSIATSPALACWFNRPFYVDGMARNAIKEVRW